MLITMQIRKIILQYGLLLLLFTLVVFEGLSAQTVVINEVMSANLNTISDEDGELPDWIELYNPANAAVSLAGYSLSDDGSDLQKWVLPEIALEPHCYLLVFASGKDRNEYISYWQAEITVGDVWKYRIGNSEPPSDWNLLSFNDANWLEGPTGIGYGDDDDATVISATNSVYIRKTFYVADVNAVRAALLHVDYDDAFIAYLNGTEIARANISGDRPPYNQPADTYTEPKIIYGGKPEQFRIDSLENIITEGSNVLAIQVHNSSLNSTDLTIIPFLTLGLQSEPAAPLAPDDLLEIRSYCLHTNFKVDSKGEIIYLTDNQGVILDEVNPGNLPNDVSYGRYPDGASNWYYYSKTTPGAPNNDSGYQRVGSCVYFSWPGGLYDSPVTLELTPDNPSSTIYYSLDGSVPTESSLVYSGPIYINATKVVRVRSIDTDALDSPIMTNTYIVGQQHNLAVIALTTAPENLWDADSGIYVMGKNASFELPFYGANFWEDWEKPVHIEFFELDGQTGFSMDAGMKIFGGWSRTKPQKSLALFARRKYGYKEIDYQVFPELPIEKFQALVLRNSANDWEYTMFRDAMMQSLVEGANIDLQAYRPAVVYLNGAYWGIHNIREKLNEHYIASHYNIDLDNLDLLENRSVPIEGDSEHYNALENYISTHDLSIPSNYEYIQSQMDIQNFIDYQTAQIFFDNRDWPGNNLKYWREKKSTGRWRWILYDTDFGFGLYNPKAYELNTLEFATATNGPEWPNPPWSTLFLRKLLENEEFKITFVNRFADLLNTNFKSDRAYQNIGYFKNLIESEMLNHFERWKEGLGWYSLNVWYYHIETLRTFAKFRPAYVTSHIIGKFHLNGVAIIKIKHLPETGKVRINSLYIDDEMWKGNYFKGLPVDLEAIPRLGYRFIEWQGIDNHNLNPVRVVPSEVMDITAVFEIDSGYTGEIVINEINYHSHPDFDSGDWVELYNALEIEKDLSGWIFRDSNAENQFVIPEGVVLKPGGFLILSNDTSKFGTQFQSAGDVCGNFEFNLSNSGETIMLYNHAGYLVDSVCYDDESPWPVGADGGGATLALIDPGLDNSKPENWGISSGYGTPGTPNIISAIDDNRNIIPDKYSVGSNYPNPFNSATIIPLNVCHASDVKILIFNVNGQLVDNLFQGRLQPGNYDFHWKPTALLPSGVYFYQIVKGRNSPVIKKMLFLK